jgi:hypothetical protein
MENSRADELAGDGDNRLAPCRLVVSTDTLADESLVEPQPEIVAAINAAGNSGRKTGARREMIRR